MKGMHRKLNQEAIYRANESISGSDINRHDLQLAPCSRSLTVEEIALGHASHFCKRLPAKSGISRLRLFGRSG